MSRSPALTAMARLWRCRRGTSAVEFSLVAVPFFVLVLCILQVGMYYMTQASLDAGIMQTADGLRNNFTQAGTPTLPPAATLKSTVVSNAGGMIQNNTTLAVEIRQLSSLSGGAVAITDGTADYGSTTSALVLRGQTSVVTFAPGFSALAVATSSAIVRRQGR